MIELRRDTGLTRALVQALPANEPCIVVVHTSAMKEHLRQMVRDLRPDVEPRLRIVVVGHLRDVDQLRGTRFYVDHAVWDCAPMPACQMLRALRPLKPPAGVAPT